MIAPDVNILFYELDITNSRYHEINLFLRRNSRRKFVLLSKVTSHFMTTYSRYIDDVGSIIEDVVLQYKKNKKSTTELSPRQLGQILEPQINTGL